VLTQSLRLPTNLIRQTKYIEAASIIANSGKRKYIMSSSCEKSLRETVRFRARGMAANSDAKPQRQLG
jgi:hypothetical protein